MNKLVLISVILILSNCSISNNELLTSEEEERIKSIITDYDLELFNQYDNLYDFEIDKDKTDYRKISIILNWKKKYSLAIKTINKELNINPKNAYALYLRGTSYNESGQSEKSLEDFNKALIIKPQQSDWLYNRGLAYYRLQDYHKAIQDYSKCIKLKPNHKKATYNRALAYEAIRDFEKSIIDYNSELKINGEMSRIYNNRGRCYMILNQNEKAMSDFQRALELEPNKSNTYYNIGVLFFRQEKYDEGCPYLKKAKLLGYDDGGLINQYCK